MHPLFLKYFQMVIAEEPPVKDNHEIDLKCAEKVTDSDNEEAFDSKDIKSEPMDGQSMAASGAKDNSDNSRDFTCKPKPIKAQRQNIDNPSSSYKHNSMYAFSSPKNPTGILPFQPTGKTRFPFFHSKTLSVGVNVIQLIFFHF